MRVLIVDDDVRKRNALRREILDVSANAAIIEVATNVHEAEQRLREASFDLMLLDLHLPIRPRQPATSEGGLELLRRIKQEATARKLISPRFVLAVSAHDEVVRAQRLKFQQEAMPLVPYSSSSEDWRMAVRSQVQRVAVALAEVRHFSSICIMTALHKIELEAVLDLPGDWTPLHLEDDPTHYYRGRFSREGKTLAVVAASAVEMGMTAAAALATKMIFRFRPRVLAMCGIAAGFTGAFGDVLIAYDSWDYGSGKRFSGTEGSIFLPRPNYLPIDVEMKNRLEDFSMSHSTLLQKIRDSWPGDAPEHAPRVHPGPLASGASVVADRSVLDGVKRQNDKLIGVEMEAYGIFAAVRGVDKPRPAALVLKSICDYGDANKDDRYQRYAAYTSARYLYEFALASLDA